MFETAVADALLHRLDLDSKEYAACFLALRDAASSRDARECVKDVLETEEADAIAAAWVRCRTHTQFTPPHKTAFLRLVYACELDAVHADAYFRVLSLDRRVTEQVLLADKISPCHVQKYLEWIYDPLRCLDDAPPHLKDEIDAVRHDVEAPFFTHFEEFFVRAFSCMAWVCVMIVQLAQGSRWARIQRWSRTPPCRPDELLPVNNICMCQLLAPFQTSISFPSHKDELFMQTFCNALLEELPTAGQEFVVAGRRICLRKRGIIRYSMNRGSEEKRDWPVYGDWDSWGNTHLGQLVRISCTAALPPVSLRLTNFAGGGSRLFLDVNHAIADGEVLTRALMRVSSKMQSQQTPCAVPVSNYIHRVVKGSFVPNRASPASEVAAHMWLKMLDYFSLSDGDSSTSLYVIGKTVGSAENMLFAMLLCRLSVSEVRHSVDLAARIDAELKRPRIDDSERLLREHAHSPISTPHSWVKTIKFRGDAPLKYSLYLNFAHGMFDRPFMEGRIDPPERADLIDVDQIPVAVCTDTWMVRTLSMGKRTFVGDVLVM